MTDTPETMPERPAYLIRRNGRYYRRECRGYTDSAIVAGRYTLEDAIAHSHPNGKDGPRDGMTFTHEDDVTDEDWLAHKAALEAVRADLCRPDRSPAGEVRVKPLEWHNRVQQFTCSEPGPISYCIMEVRNRVYGIPGEHDGAAEFASLEAAMAAAQADYEARISAALSPAPAPEREGLMTGKILEYTFAVQYNPNCPSPWLVRMPGGSAIIDMKPTGVFGWSKADLTDDILGYGKTFDEAARAAIAAYAESQR